MVWRRSPAFFVLWILVLLFYAVRAVLLRGGSLGYPALEPVEFLNFFLTIFMVPPVVAAFSCLSTPSQRRASPGVPPRVRDLPPVARQALSTARLPPGHLPRRPGV